MICITLPLRRLTIGVLAATAAGASLAADTVDVVRHNAAIAHAAYGDSLVAAQTLDTAVAALLAAPSEATLAAAREAWKAAREPYGQTEVYRFRNGPIDNLGDDGELAPSAGPEGRINAWPLDEALIDYVAQDVDGNAVNQEQPASSLIHNLDFAISKKSLIESNELGGNEANVASGYHAIEFLLWGQDLNAGESAWDGQAPRDATPGQRPFSDYLASEQCTSGTGNRDKPAICERRGQYLQTAVALLVDDLRRLVDAWDPQGEDNYYQLFTAPERVQTSLLEVLVGMGSLSYGELAGERMLVALAANSQEDEHSCFSDNTHRDILLNALGIQNTYLGHYVRPDGTLIDGPGLSDLVAVADPALDQRLEAELEDTLAKVAAIDAKANSGIPFDQQIAQFPGEDRDGRPILNANLEHNLGVNEAIVALRAQTRSIEAAIKALLGDVDFEIEDSPAFL